MEPFVVKYVKWKKRYSLFRKIPSQVSVAGTFCDLTMASGNPWLNFYTGTDLVASTMNWKKWLWHGDSVSPSKKYLKEINIKASSATWLPCTFIVWAVMGFYPYIDCDSVDEQIMDNTEPVQSANDGEWVLAYLVAQTPVGISGSSQFKITYRNQDGVSGRESMYVNTTTTPTNIASFIHGSSASLAWWRFNFIPLAPWDTGIQIVEKIQFVWPIGWLAALVLFKPLAETKLLEVAAWHEKNILLWDGDLPEIPDETYLSMICAPNWSLSGLALTGSIKTIILNS